MIHPKPLQTAMFEPASQWKPPAEYPRLWEAKRISVDVEVRDDGLKEGKGSGWPTRNGYIAGYAFATEERSWYFPTRHEAGGNMDPDVTLRWVRDVMKAPSDKLVFNMQYDAGWLRAEGVTQIGGTWLDASVPVPLLDENRFRYNLDSVASDYLGQTKDETLLRQAAQACNMKDVKADLWRLHPRYVGGYAQQDAALLFPLWDKLHAGIVTEELTGVLDLELRLLPMLVEMRARGVRFDEARAYHLEHILRAAFHEQLGVIRTKWNAHVDVDSAGSIAAVCDRLGIAYPRTPKTKVPSFTRDWLEAHDHPFIKSVLTARGARTLLSLLESFRGYVIDGRVHCEFNPMKAERDGDGVRGAVSGRFSCSSPNLQQVPERDEVYGPMFRALFLPEPGEKWAKLDYSQEEYRLIVHYAVVLKLPGAAEAAAKYKDRDADFHQILADMIGLPRKPTKNINFGVAYGEGVIKLARVLGRNIAEAQVILKQYHENAPFMKMLSEACSTAGQERGFVRTMLGRKCRFPYYEPKRYRRREDGYVFEFLTQEQAVEKWPNEQLQRAFTYRAMNRVIQGTAGDFIKKAMVEEYAETRLLPLLTVHDELDFSTPDLVSVQRVASMMENVSPTQLHVPLPVKPELGPNWSLKS